MTLSEGKNNESCRILAIPKGESRGQAMRLGLYEGAICRFVRASKKGAVVLALNGSLLAIGHMLAKQIQIRKV